MRINPHDAYLLHRRKYRETSAILDILSVEHGLTSVLLKGAYGKQTKNRRPVPEPFQQLYLGWTGKADLPTVTHIEPNAPYERLNGMALYCGMYVNELIMRLVGRGEQNKILFALYQSVLADLLNKDLLIEQTLRRFEKYLLEVCGYGLLLDGEADSHEAIEADRLYFYHLEHGPGREKIAVDDIPVSGQTLLSFSADEALGPDQLQQTKRLMRAVLRHYLGDKPLASRALFEQQSS